MGNDLTKNPFLVDSASSTAITTNRIKIAKIRWVGGTTAGHECKVTDKNGTILFSSFAAGANNIDEATYERTELNADGIIVPTLASGKVYIYYK